MAGSEVSFTSVKPGQPTRRVLSASANEIDVVTPPQWATHYALYVSAAARVSVENSGVKTTSDSGADTDNHSPVPANTWMNDALVPATAEHTNNLYISSATASAVYQIKFYSNTRHLG